MNRIPNETATAIIEALLEGKSRRWIIKHFKVGNSVITRLKKSLSNDGCNDEIIKDVGKDKVFISTRSLKIKTLEEALAYSDVDLSIWEVDRYIINSWEVTMKNKHGAPIQRTNYQVKVWLKKMYPVLIAWENIVERLKNNSPVVPKIKYPLPKKDMRRMLEISLFDYLSMSFYHPGRPVDVLETVVELAGSEISTELKSTSFILLQSLLSFKEFLNSAFKFSVL